jgi:hypothetical protein
MFPLRKTGFLLATAGALLAGINPAHALTTSPVAVTNPNVALPTSPATTTVNSLGFNSTNFASIWAAAPTGFIPKLTDVRLFTKGTLSGGFTATNTDTVNSLVVSSPALTFKERSNMMNSGDLSTTNTTGTLAPASSSTVTTNEILAVNPPVPPGPQPTSPCASGWQVGSLVGNFQVWNCSTTTVTPTTQNFTINPSAAVTMTNWSLIGAGNTYGVTDSFWSANAVNIPSAITLSFTGFTPTAQNAQFALNGSGSDNYLVYSYEYISAQVPAPLPIAGAGLAFGFSRRLRRRIQSNSGT